MKKIILSVLLAYSSMLATAQMRQHQSAGYEAASWKTWLLDHPETITVKAPPGNAVSKSEIQVLKKGLQNMTAQKLEAIKYWNAGAPAYRWNQILPGLVDQKPEIQIRIPAAWMNMAIYDATILAWKEKVKYKRERPGIFDPSLHSVVDMPLTYSYPCEHSVTAAAAATVLAYFFPLKADSILQMAHEASQSRVDAGVQFPSDVEAGWELGAQVGRQIIEKAKNDGSAIVFKGPVNKDPKKWTGPYPMGISLPFYTPLVIRSAGQFRPPPPPDFTADMKELKSFKSTFKSRSTAYFWANSGELWMELAGQKMFEYRMSDDAPAVARIYCVLTTAYHEMAIAVFDAKYTYWGIRPFQFDTTYKSLIPTPPFPGYPSGHAAGAATSCAVMEYFFPADAKEFHRLAQDCADSRFYAGIHFRTDNETALKMGEEIGKYVVQAWMNK